MRPLLVMLVCTAVLGAAGFARSGGVPHAAVRAPAPVTGDFAWPLAGQPALARPFNLGIPESPGYGPGHRGVDLVGEIDQPVKATGEGLVVYAGWLVDRNLVSIEHPGGLRTTYEPVNPTVGPGQHVTIGQLIGHLEAGHPECSAPSGQACLHWGARRGEDYLNPLRLLSRGVIRLLPWREQSVG